MESNNGAQALLPDAPPPGYRRLLAEEEIEWNRHSFALALAKEQLRGIDCRVDRANAEIALAKLERERALAAMARAMAGLQACNKTLGIAKADDFLELGGRPYVRIQEPAPMPDDIYKEATPGVPKA